MPSMQTKIDDNSSYAIYHDIAIKAGDSAIFRALSSPDELINWWPLKCSGDARLYGHYQFYFGEAYDWKAEVIDFRPVQKFSVRMLEADEDWTNTVFSFELAPSDSGVLVQFSHTGWSSCNAHFRRTSFCWAMLLNGLKNYVERGVIVPFEKRE